VSLGDLAAHVGLSPYHLLRSFRAQVGITPGAYQIQLRVLEARRRLREGAGIAATATELGFADQSHLTRHFQRIMGTSPGRYLQQ
jgi:AraC-like DNA-binding protein